MMYQFGDKLINTKLVYAVSKITYNTGVYVTVYFDGQEVVCTFEFKKDEWVVKEIISSKNKKHYEHYLVLTDGALNKSTGVGYFLFSKFGDSVAYKRVSEEVDKLKEIIELT